MAEEYVKNHPADSIKLVANSIGSTKRALIKVWTSIDFRVSLETSLISTLQAQAHWAKNSQLTNAIEMPNYLDHIEPSFLQAIKATPLVIKSDK